jgi:hypothetical protein
VDLLEIVKAAWDRTSFACSRAKSIHGFSDAFTEIFVEVRGKNSEPGRTGSQGRSQAPGGESPFVEQRRLEHEKKRLEELIAEHPANVESANHDDECPEDAKVELKKMRGRLEVVKDTLAGRKGP